MDYVDITKYGDLFELNEADLEQIATNENSDNARYVLGTKAVEGNDPERVKKNDKKGITWLREAAGNDHLDSQEYLAYYDIRFEKVPNIRRIMAYLEAVVEKKESTRALTTLAEFYINQRKERRSVERGFELYKKSAELGDLIANYWVGVLLHRGQGVEKEVKEGIKYLEKASELGNVQADYELFDIYAREEGFEDLPKAYNYFCDAIENGFTSFQELQEFFKKNIDVLKDTFLQRKHSEELKLDSNDEIQNLHDAYTNDLMSKFTDAMRKDQLYKRATAYMTDGLIWMMKVLKNYMVESVLRFDHQDFLIAMRDDIPPLISEVGVWLFNTGITREKELGNKEQTKKLKICLDIIKKILDKGIEYFEKEGKYHLMNKYSPKKCPDQHIKRQDVKFLYSYKNYARPEYFMHLEKLEEDAKNELEKTSIKCAHCGVYQGEVKHKLCSACKKRYYCSVTCQKEDWKAQHKKE
jgi:TPR repeat protein